jgi:hypothetical protein
LSSYAYGEPVPMTLYDASNAVASPWRATPRSRSRSSSRTARRSPGRRPAATLNANPYVFTPTQTGRHSYYFVTTTPNGATVPQPFDVAAAGAVALVSLQDVKDDLGKTGTTDDDELQRTIFTATAILLNHPAYRVSDAVAVTTRTQWAPSNGCAIGEVIVLDHYPVVAVTSVTEYTPLAQVIAAEPLDTTGTFTGWGYTIDNATGILTRTSSGLRTYWRGRVKIVYTSGSTSVPDDIKQACLVLVAHLWETQRGGVGTVPTGLDLADDTSAPFGVGFTCRTGSVSCSSLTPGRPRSHDAVGDRSHRRADLPRDPSRADVGQRLRRADRLR